MKNVIFGACLTVMIGLTIMILFSMNAKKEREEELYASLSNALMDTATQVYTEHTYTINNEDEFIADFLETFLTQIDSDSEITVNVYACDLENGLFTVEAIEKFKYPYGTTGQIACNRTIILDRANGVDAELN